MTQTPLNNTPVYFVADVESDGATPFSGSMIAMGLVRLDRQLDQRFSAKLKPIRDTYEPCRLSICGTTREETLAFPKADVAMRDLRRWLRNVTDQREARLISDNIAYDAMWLNCYTDQFCSRPLFGHSGHRIGDFCDGVKQWFAGSQNWKTLRPRPLSHDPLDDALNNAEALIAFCEQYNIDLPFYEP